MSGHGHGHHDSENKTVALIIAVLALLLSVAEILGQKTQTHTLQSNIEASNLWAFFQAKTLRKTVADSAADQMQATLSDTLPAAQKAAITAQIAKFRATAKRMESEPESHEGRKELAERAKEAEHHRDVYGKQHGRFELASGAFQIAIVVASASIITGMAIMLWGAGALAIIGVVMLISGLMTT